MVIGKSDLKKFLNEKDIFDLCSQVFESMNLDDKRLLFIIPDNSRTAPIATVFRTVYKLLSDRIKSLDFLIDLGTNKTLKKKPTYERVRMSQKEKTQK